MCFGCWVSLFGVFCKEIFNGGGIINFFFRKKVNIKIFYEYRIVCGVGVK